MTTKGMPHKGDMQHRAQRNVPAGKHALSRREFVTAAAGMGAIIASACGAGSPKDDSSQEGERSPWKPTKVEKHTPHVEELVASLSLEQKLAQMIMPSLRSWNGKNVVDLSSAKGLASVLRNHQYGGVLLYGQNFQDPEQAVRLIARLQANNSVGAQASSSHPIPYFVATEQEGGSVIRLTMGTRGTGSMAIGATGESAEQNAYETGRIFGEELSALGINVDLGPCFDIVTDPIDPCLSTRQFSDDPNTVVTLCRAFAEGLATGDVIAAYKYFPGAGNGGATPTASSATIERLWNEGLYAFATLMDTGVDMVVTSSMSFPSFDDSHVLSDGESTASWPASMSSAVVTQILRNALRYDGVVLTDILDSERFRMAPDSKCQLLPGDSRSADYGIRVAASCINAGCDILLVPMDLSSAEEATWYDDYIGGLASLVKRGIIPSGRIDDAVRHILRLKEQRGILELNPKETDISEAVKNARKVVGSPEHHDMERAIAEQAITLLKNYDTLPVPGHETSVVFIGRTRIDAIPITTAIDELTALGIIDASALVVNLTSGEITGSHDSKTRITIGRYYDTDEGYAYDDELSEAVSNAKFVICFSTMRAGSSALQNDDDCVKAIATALSECHASEGRFVLLSDNIPVDAARFARADAIVCAYLSAGFDVEPPPPGKSTSIPAINANITAALRAIFGAQYMPGTLPINIPAIEENDEGTWEYSPHDMAYPRGTNV